MALAMQAAVERFQSKQGENIQIRIGINTGIVVAGVIGTRNLSMTCGEMPSMLPHAWNRLVNPEAFR
jgi:class 3 adenylate cyclase